MNDIISPTQPKKSFWQTLLKTLGYNQKFFWTTFWFIVGFIVMLIPIFCAQATNKIIFAPACLWAFAYMMGGIVIGFIFGIPTIISSGQPAPALAANQTEEQKTATKIRADKIVQVNTNLTQISDWFTKIIVGAGLVQLSKIPDFIKDISKKMARGLEFSASPSNHAFAAVFSGGIIILFLTYGFVFGYLIMRIILTEIFAD